MILMTIGVGIFAVLSSFLASFLLGGSNKHQDTSSLHEEMRAVREENAVMREQLDVVIKVLEQKELDEG